MIHPVKVAMRKMKLTDTVKVVNGERVFHKNDDVVIYDTSSPFTDLSVPIDLRKGLPRLREAWIKERRDAELLPAPL